MRAFTNEPAHIARIRETVSRFAAAEVSAEQARRYDREHTFPRDAFARFAELGFCGLTIDQAYGGQGRDLVAAVAVIEELCRAGAACLAGPYIHCAFYGGVNISENGSEAQKRDLLPQLARGELLFAYGLSEPDVGGDLAAVRTTARLNPDGRTLTLEGTKRWCTGADFAGFIYCLVRSHDDDRRYKNLSFVLVPPDTDGVTIEPLDHVNLRYTLSSDVTFEGVTLPVENIVGGADGWQCGWNMLAGKALDVEKLEITAVTFGIAEAAVEEAWRYAQERRQFGKPISGHQSVRHALVDARTALEACRHMLYHGAWLAQTGKPCSVETSMAKLFVAERAAEIAIICQRVLGAYALSGEYAMERYVRDLLGMAIVGGSSNMQRNNIANRLGLAD